MYYRTKHNLIYQHSETIISVHELIL